MNDLKTAYEILEDMHQLILAQEIFPEKLKEEGKLAIQVLGKAESDDYNTMRSIEDTRELIQLQLKINEDNEKRKAKAWERMHPISHERVNGDI